MHIGRCLATVRPIVRNQDEARADLYDYLSETEYKYIDEHVDLLRHAAVFTCVAGEEIAGYIWFYQLEEDPDMWVVHMTVHPAYQRRFFNRTLVNTVFATCYAYGCEQVLAENESSEILERFGGRPHPDGGIVLDMPYTWR